MSFGNFDPTQLIMLSVSMSADPPSVSNRRITMTVHLVLKLNCFLVKKYYFEIQLLVSKRNFEQSEHLTAGHQENMQSQLPTMKSLVLINLQNHNLGSS